MKATQITLTPAIAQALLDKNPSNRRLSEQRAIHLANAIRRGEWQLNGESVIVGEDGALLDGQHRCRAVVIAEMAIPVILVEGVAPKAFTTIDIGEKRSVGQIFQMQGFSDANNLSATISVLEMYTQNRTARRPLTFAQRSAVLQNYPAIVESIAVTRKIRQMPPSVAAVGHFLAQQAYGKTFADQWFIDFRQAVYDEPTRILALYLAKHKPARHNDLYSVLVVVMKALSASASGTSLKKINTVCSNVYPSL
jgi:hypothetical protein